jgi:hypothetical protein
MTELPADQAYIAALWEHPTLCLAFFGVQFHTGGDGGSTRRRASTRK